MADLAQKIMGKPSDLSIRLIRGIFALLLVVVIYFGWDVTGVKWGLPQECKYVLYTFPALGFLRALIDPGLFHKKVWKWILRIAGSLLIVFAIFFLENQPLSREVPLPIDGEATGIDINALPVEQPTQPFTLATKNWCIFFGILILFVGLFLNNKNITRKNEKHAQIIKKIRV